MTQRLALRAQVSGTPVRLPRGHKFDLLKPTAIDINEIIKSLDTNKATGPDGIPAKFVQISANVIDCHLSNIITCDIKK